jgi:RNA polymerase sigma factor (sigma-70 family)
VIISDTKKQELELLGKFFAGDDAAFHTLFHSYNKKLTVFAIKLLSDSEAARDTVQEVWLKLIDQRKKPPTVEHVAAYLFQIARNCCYDKLRSRKDIPSLDTLDETEHPHQLMSEPSALEEIVLQVFAELPDEERELLSLNIYSGFGYDEIAEMQQKKSQAVWTRASRIRAKLRTQIEARCNREGVEILASKK